MIWFGINYNYLMLVYQDVAVIMESCFRMCNMTAALVQSLPASVTAPSSFLDCSFTKTDQDGTDYSNDIQNAVPVLHEVKYSCDFFLKDEHPAEAGNTKYIFACKHVLARQSM